MTREKDRLAQAVYDLQAALAEVIEEGLVLHAADRYEEWLRRELEGLKKRFGLQRIPGGWRITVPAPA